MRGISDWEKFMAIINVGCGIAVLLVLAAVAVLVWWPR